MKIGKLELTQEKLIMVVAATIAVTAVALYVIFYAPLMKKMKVKYLECRSIEADVIDMRNIITAAGEVYGGRILPTEEEVHSALDELTRHGGRTEGVNFISISPKEIKKEKDAEYKIMPVEMKVESSYEKLGVFLGSLDDLEKGVVKIKSFDIDRDETKPGVFLTDVVIEVYISGREEKHEE